MRVFASIVFAAIMAGVGAGCTARHRACASPALGRASGHVEIGTRADDSSIQVADLLRSYSESRWNGNGPTPARARKFLALSGGGKYGAYSTGILAGWTAAGTRPCFDTVTGVSTGGLIATFAFLGSQYDRTLAELYTSVCNRDIYRKRVLGSALFSDSSASSAPLRRLIESHATEELLAAVAREHQAGRRLYVGTTNIDTRRFVIWDLGAIAASGRPDSLDLYRRVLLASASPPGFLPPVRIEVEVNGRKYTELHVDGGATKGVFLRVAAPARDAASLDPSSASLAGSDAYVIVAGKLYADPACVRNRAIRIGTSALDSLLHSQMRGELSGIHSLCVLSGMKYHLASLPDDFDASGEAMTFDPGEMRRLYDAGYAAAASGGRLWRGTPPGAEPHERVRPRGGAQFLAPGRLEPLPRETANSP